MGKQEADVTSSSSSRPPETASPPPETEPLLGDLPRSPSGNPSQTENLTVIKFSQQHFEDFKRAESNYIALRNESNTLHGKSDGVVGFLTTQLGIIVGLLISINHIINPKSIVMRCFLNGLVALDTILIFYKSFIRYQELKYDREVLAFRYEMAIESMMKLRESLSSDELHCLELGAGSKEISKKYLDLLATTDYRVHKKLTRMVLLEIPRLYRIAILVWCGIFVAPVLFAVFMD